MTAPLQSAAPEDRSHFEVAAAVVRKVAQLSQDLPNEAAVWSAFAQWRGAALGDYVQTIRQTRHSLFYYQLQHLYEFSLEHIPPDCREGFCFSAGRHFAEALLNETIYPILQGALAKPGAVQAALVDMVRTYLSRFAGNKYQLDAEFHPDQIILRIRDTAAGAMGQYLPQYGLNPTRCFRNSFHFIAGTVDGFTAQIIKDYQPNRCRFVIVERCGNIHLAVGAGSAFNYEWVLQTLLGFIQRVQARQRLEVEETQFESDLVVASPLMRETWDKVRRASQCDEVVLLLGESGTGKTFVAKKIHASSRRCQGPFVEVGVTSDLGSDNIVLSNLFGHERGAFTGATEQKQGLFSLAAGGTILLDEIGDASPELQAKLLRVLDTRTFKRLGGVRDIQVDVRVIAATHQPLEAMVREGKFRKDLYYRLNVIPIHVPPLREQPESVPVMADFLLARLVQASGRSSRKLSPELRSPLQRYPWPGNIRELEHALRHALAMSDAETLELADFPNDIRAHFQAQPALPGRDSLPPNAASRILDLEAFRLAIRTSDPRLLAHSVHKHEFACHIDSVRKACLAVLIDECKGDLSLIGHYWDHHSEKTLRNLIQAYGLANHLQEARAGATPTRSP
jgi:DNA-binding NtrC family response regulator